MQPKRIHEGRIEESKWITEIGKVTGARELQKAWLQTGWEGSLLTYQRINNLSSRLTVVEKTRNNAGKNHLSIGVCYGPFVRGEGSHTWEIRS